MLCSGARAALDQLLDEVLAESQTSGDDLSSLARPLRIIVPSSSLREHVAAALTERAGRSLLGISIHTLHGAANAILAGALSAEMEQPTRGAALFPLLCRREAAEAPALSKVLMELEDGLGVVVGSIADLLDAGFEPSLAEGVEELLAERATGSGMGSAALDRARELCAAAARVATEMGGLGVERTGGLLGRAGERLRADPDGGLPCRGLWIFGFADLTGVAADFLEILRHTYAARVLVDVPPDPTSPERPDPGAAFAQRLLERFGEAGVQDSPTPAKTPAILQAVEAHGTSAEIFEVSQRVRALLEQGVAPEKIGVVARQAEPYAVSLRATFLREGIPFHGGGAKCSMGEAGRFLATLVRCFRERDALSVESWLDLRCAPPSIEGDDSTSARSLRRTLLAMAYEVGAGRVEHLAALLHEDVSPPAPKTSAGLVRREEPKGVAWRVDRPRATTE